MIIVHTSIPVKSERRAEAIEAAETLAEQSRKEDGMISYRAMTDIRNPNLVRFFEQYESVEALEEHVEKDYYHTFNDELPNFIDGQIETIQAHVDESETVQLDIDELLAEQ